MTYHDKLHPSVCKENPPALLPKCQTPRYLHVIAVAEDEQQQCLEAAGGNVAVLRWTVVEKYTGITADIMRQEVGALHWITIVDLVYCCSTPNSDLIKNNVSNWTNQDLETNGQLRPICEHMWSMCNVMWATLTDTLGDSDTNDMDSSDECSLNEVCKIVSMSLYQWSNWVNHLCCIGGVRDYSAKKNLLCWQLCRIHFHTLARSCSFIFQICKFVVRRHQYGVLTKIGKWSAGQVIQGLQRGQCCGLGASILIIWLLLDWVQLQTDLDMLGPYVGEVESSCR